MCSISEINGGFFEKLLQITKGYAIIIVGENQKNSFGGKTNGQHYKFLQSDR